MTVAKIGKTNFLSSARTYLSARITRKTVAIYTAGSLAASGAYILVSKVFPEGKAEAEDFMKGFLLAIFFTSVSLGIKGLRSLQRWKAVRTAFSAEKKIENLVGDFEKLGDGDPVGFGLVLRNLSTDADLRGKVLATRHKMGAKGASLPGKPEAPPPKRGGKGPDATEYIDPKKYGKLIPLLRFPGKGKTDDTKVIPPDSPDHPSKKKS